MFKGKYDTATSHRQMLQDSYRTFSYKKAIENSIQQCDVVIDYGAGSGILSIIAARAGARKVYAIERNKTTAAVLKYNIALNNLYHIIEVYEGDADSFISYYNDINVDVIISECIGDHLFENKMVYEFLLLCSRFSPRCKIPNSMGLYYYPGKISLKQDTYFENLKNLNDCDIKIDLCKLPEVSLDIGYFENYCDDSDPYFKLIDKIGHEDCTEVFQFESIEHLRQYQSKENIISNIVKVNQSQDFILLYFYAKLTPNIVFHNHPSRPCNMHHSYYQRLIPNVYSDHINISINFLYDQTANEDEACQNIQITNYV